MNSLLVFFPSMLISVGITTYKRLEYLRDAIDSVLNQTYSEIEVLVGNNNPDLPVDGKLIGIEDSRVKWINHQQNLGQVKNMNHLLSVARGRWFTWLADDDLFAPNFFETAMHGINKNSLKVFFSGFESGLVPGFSERNTEYNRIEILNGAEYCKKYIFRDVQVIGNYGIWEIETLRELGGMPNLGTGFSPYSDNLLALKAARLNQIGFTAQKLVFFRTHPQSLSWSSQDIGAYTSSQKDLVPQVFSIIDESVSSESEVVRSEFIKHWCLDYFFSVLERSRIPTYSVLLNYFIWSLRQTSRFRLSTRAKLSVYYFYGFMRLIKRKVWRKLKQLAAR